MSSKFSDEDDLNCVRAKRFRFDFHGANLMINFFVVEDLMGPPEFQTSGGLTFRA